MDVRTDESTATFVPMIVGPAMIVDASALGPLVFGASAEC
jgi:hypothetical protein